MMQPEQGCQPGARLGTQVEVHERQVPGKPSPQLLVQLIDGRRHRKVPSERLLEVRTLTGHVVNQKYTHSQRWPSIAFRKALAHRAWNPPTSSSLADEKRVCSLLLSEAVRDSRRSRPVINCRSLIICGLDHSLSGTQRAVTVLVAPLCAEVSDPERSPRRASSRAELVPGVFHTPSTIAGASSVTEIATRPSSGAIATSIAPAPAFKALPTRSLRTNRARSRSVGESVSTVMSHVGLGPNRPRQCEYRSLEILHAPRAVTAELGERQGLA